MIKDQMDISDILGEHLGNAPLLTTRSRKFDELMRYYSKGGYSLSLVGDKQHLNRKPSTLKKRARILGLTFPDYAPRHLRKKANSDAPV